MVLNAHSLIYLVLFLQVLLCLAGAFDLTWREYIRLAIISAVLLFLYPRFRKYFTGQEGIREQEADRSSRNHSQSLERYFPQILALTFTFLITQFNPATGQASHLVPQTQLNWFFACSTGLIALAFGLFIYSSRRISPWHTAFRPFDNLDKLVLGVCSFALLLSIGSELVFSSVSPSLQVWTSSIIVLDFLLLWFLITRLFGKKDSSRTPEEGWVPRIRRAVYELIVLVCAAIVIAGVYRGIETAYYLEKGEGYLDAGEYDQAISEYIRAREINQVLDSDLIRQAYLDDLLMLYGEKKDEGGLNAILEEFDRHFRRKFDRNKAGNLYYDAGFWKMR